MGRGHIVAASRSACYCYVIKPWYPRPSSSSVSPVRTLVWYLSMQLLGFLITCPKYRIFLPVYICQEWHGNPCFLQSQSLDFFTVHDTHNIGCSPFISKVCICCSSVFLMTKLLQPLLANYRPSVITKLELHAYIFGTHKSGARGEHDSQHGNEYKLYDQIVKSRT